MPLRGSVEQAFDGLSKWKGAACGPDGRIYFAPYDAISVLVFDPITSEMEHLDEGLILEAESSSVSGCRWSGIALGPDDRLYCAPCHATSVLVIDPATGKLSHIVGAGSKPYKWTGIALGSDGRLYCAPSQASEVLIIDARAGTLARIGGGGEGGGKWAGIAAGPDGCLYCAPHCATSVLVVDPHAMALRFLQVAGAGACSRYRWAGLALGRDGRLYCAPYNASGVLAIDALAGWARQIPGAGESACKWSGIALGLDGRLYCAPARSDFVLALDPASETYEQFEAVGRGNAKWSGVCASLDGFLYCAPYNKSAVLVLPPQMSLPGEASEASGGWRAPVSEETVGLSLVESASDEFAKEKAALRREMEELALDQDADKRQRELRILQLRWHPDKNPDDPRRATRLFQHLQELRHEMGF